MSALKTWALVDLLGLQIALGLRGGGGKIEPPPHSALRDAGAERHQGERMTVDAGREPVGKLLQDAHGRSASRQRRRSRIGIRVEDIRPLRRNQGRARPVRARDRPSPRVLILRACVRRS